MFLLGIKSEKNPVAGIVTWFKIFERFLNIARIWPNLRLIKRCPVVLEFITLRKNIFTNYGASRLLTNIKLIIFLESPCTRMIYFNQLGSVVPLYGETMTNLPWVIRRVTQAQPTHGSKLWYFGNTWSNFQYFANSTFLSFLLNWNYLVWLFIIISTNIRLI